MFKKKKKTYLIDSWEINTEKKLIFPEKVRNLFQPDNHAHILCTSLFALVAEGLGFRFMLNSDQVPVLD